MLCGFMDELPLLLFFTHGTSPVSLAIASSGGVREGQREIQL